MRFMPIEGVCYAGLEDISKLAKKLLPEHFPAGADAETVTVRALMCSLLCNAMWLIGLLHSEAASSPVSSCGAVWCAV